jgi:basic membrane lipoprotein Med (substrate-binding protein (PBP1-ABC) superfamily)
VRSSLHIVATVAVLAAVGCSPEVVPPPRAPFRVTMLMAETVDAMWQEQADAVLRRLRDDLGLVVSRELVRGPGGRQRALESCGRDEVDLVLCVGQAFERPVLALAQRYGMTAFVLAPGSVTASNVAVIDFQPFGAAYIGGVVAAVEGGDTAGVILGDGDPWLDAVTAGFEDGFRSRHPSGRVIAATGTAGVHELSEARVEVALYAASRADADVIEAARASGLRLIGIGHRALRQHPEVVIAAVSVDLPEAVDRITRDVLDGTFQGRSYVFDLGSGVVDLSLSPGLRDTWTDRDRAQVDEARAAVTAGLVELERMGFQ